MPIGLCLASREAWQAPSSFVFWRKNSHRGTCGIKSTSRGIFFAKIFFFFFFFFFFLFFLLFSFLFFFFFFLHLLPPFPIFSTNFFLLPILLFSHLSSLVAKKKACRASFGAKRSLVGSFFIFYFCKKNSCWSTFGAKNTLAIIVSGKKIFFLFFLFLFFFLFFFSSLFFFFFLFLFLHLLLALPIFSATLFFFPPLLFPNPYTIGVPKRSV